jgi:tRNA1(Val) A37 N6-methylase TrmN6
MAQRTKQAGTADFDRCPADTYLLAAFAWRNLSAGENGLRVLDLGCGPGRVLYEFQLKCPEAIIAGVDVLPEMLERAADALRALDVPVELRDNLYLSDARPGIIHLVRADVRSIPEMDNPAVFDAVLINAPYFSPEQGRLAPDPVRAQYRHEMRGGIKDFLAAARHVLSPSGSVLTIYPPRFSGRLESAALGLGLHKTAEQAVYSGPDAFEPRWWLARWKTGQQDRQTEKLAPVKDPDAFMDYKSK